MATNHRFTRVDTLELKDLIYRKIGHQRAEMYFDQLKRFFGLKLGKADFAKSCIRIIDRENLPLHNLLIRSIMRNACKAKIPPQKSPNVDKLGVEVANGHQKNSLQSLNDDALPRSPCKCRSPLNRGIKFRDRPSPLGPLGKSPSITCEETVTRTQEQQSATELNSLSSKPPLEEDGEEVEQFYGSPTVRALSPVTAPLGVISDVDSTRKTLRRGFTNGSLSGTCQHSGKLPDTRSLMSRLQKKLEMDGVGISVDCANLLNNSLDVFLKRIIEPCMGNARSQCAEPRILGKRLSNQMMSGLNGMVPGRFARRPEPPMHASIQDFRVAMETNARVLGKDQSVQLQKICNYALRVVN